MSEWTMRASQEKLRACSLNFTRLTQKIQRAGLALKLSTYIYRFSVLEMKGKERPKSSSQWMATSLGSISSPESVPMRQEVGALSWGISGVQVLS